MQSVRRIDKPWGHELVWAETPHYVCKVLCIRQGEQLSYQYHRQKDESIYLVEGTMDLEYEMHGDRRCERLNVGEAFHIPCGMRHRMIAIADCRVLEVATPQVDDIVRLEDCYGRA